MPPIKVVIFKPGDLVKLNPILDDWRRDNRIDLYLPPPLIAPGQLLRVLEVETVDRNGTKLPEGVLPPHPQLVTISAGGILVGVPGFKRVRPLQFTGYLFVK